MTSTSSADIRPFRFGVVTPVQADLKTWRDQVRRIADLGYSTVLLPDVPRWQPAPGPTLAVAAEVADVRVGTWVYASALRPSFHTAWEAHSLSVLTDGRFEMGIGVGRPGIEDLGLPVAPAGERLDRIRETVAELRELDGDDLHTPVVLAARGPKAIAVAAEIADTVAFAIMPDDSRAAVSQAIHDFRAIGDAELAQHVAVVGDTVAPFMAGTDIDVAGLHATDSLACLPDDPAAVVDELQRRRDELGLSYFVFGSVMAEALAPVVADLAGS